MILSLRTIACSIHHLFFITVALCSGIVMQAWYAPLPVISPLLITIFTLIITIGSLIRQGRMLLWLLLPGAFIVGALRYQMQQTEYKFFQNLFQGYHERLIGTVTEKENLQHPYLRQRITLSLISHPKILLYIFTPQKIAVIPGDTLQINHLIISKNTQHEYHDYLTKEGITFSVFLKKENSYKILALGKKTLSQRLSIQRNRILWSIKKKLSKETFTLFAAIFLGYKHATKEDLVDYKNLFKNWGLLHYLARAGLHVVIIIWLLQLCTRCIPCAFSLKQILMVLFVLLYWLSSWPSIPFIRAISTFFLYSFCVMVRWRSSFLHLLTLSCFCTLLLNPLQLFFLDFQLSYGVTYALAFIAFSPPAKS